MDRTSKQHVAFLVIGFLVGVGAIYVFAFKQAQRENLALRLQLLSLSQEKRRATPWRQLVSSEREQTSNIQEQVEEEAPRQHNQNVQAQSEEVPISSLSTAGLAQELTDALESIQYLELSEIELAIELADEMIARQPLAYSAYKAKLIALLVMEGKYDVTAYDNEIAFLLNRMAGFVVEDNEKLLTNQAFASSRSATQIRKIEENIDALSVELDLVENQIDMAAPQSGRVWDLALKQQQLIQEMNEAEQNLTELDRPEVPSLELMEIPLKRELARGHHEVVIEDATALIEAFPGSLIGHYYLIRALRLDQQMEEALMVIENLDLPEEKSRELQRRLRLSRAPQEYWKHLSF